MSIFEAPPFISAPSKYVSEYGSRRLAHQAASGELVRIRQGLYLTAEMWQAMRPWEKYRMQIQAVHELAAGRPVFARESAAQILGLPLASVPPRVQTVVPPGQGGGRSRKTLQRMQAIAADSQPWEMFGLLVTPPVQTVRDLAVHLPLSGSLPAMDRLMSQRILPGSPCNVQLTFTEANVAAAIELLSSASQQYRALRVLELADGQSGSTGESLSRAIMIENGFPAPALQVPFHDSRGLVGFPDFDWEEFKTLGEFDGHEKYSAQKYLRGRTPAEVVISEKNRENRLRACGYNVVRREWDDLKNPQRLINLLRSAGLPQQCRGR